MWTPIGIDLANVSCILLYWFHRTVSFFFIDISFPQVRTACCCCREMFDVCCVFLLECSACCVGADICKPDIQNWIEFAEPRSTSMWFCRCNVFSSFSGTVVKAFTAFQILLHILPSPSELGIKNKYAGFQVHRIFSPPFALLLPWKHFPPPHLSLANSIQPPKPAARSVSQFSTFVITGIQHFGTHYLWLAKYYFYLMSHYL